MAPVQEVRPAGTEMDVSNPAVPEQRDSNAPEKTIEVTLDALRNEVRDLFKHPWTRKDMGADLVVTALSNLEEAIRADERLRAEEKFKEIVENSTVCMVEQYPSWRMADAMFEKRRQQSAKEHHGAETMLRNQMEVVGHFGKLNPWADQLTADEDGQIETKRHEVAIVFTDMRDFAGVGHILQSRTFPALKETYIHPLIHLATATDFGMKVLNTAGDSFVFYCTDKKDKQGNVVEKMENLAMRFALEVRKWTTVFAQKLYKKGFRSTEGKPHRTGIGVTMGSLMFGDGARNDHHLGGAPGEIRDEILAEMETTYPPLPAADQPAVLMAMGDPLNLAARLQELHGSAEYLGKYNIFVDERLFLFLRKDYRDSMVSLDQKHLKHMGTETYIVHALPDDAFVV